jgi:hypothetical protein
VDGIDQEGSELIKAVHRNMITKRPACDDRWFEWNGRRMLAPAQKIDFNQVDLARKNLILLAFIKIASLFSGVLFVRLSTSIEVTNRLPSRRRV